MEHCRSHSEDIRNTNFAEEMGKNLGLKAEDFIPFPLSYRNTMGFKDCNQISQKKIPDEFCLLGNRSTKLPFSI